jgi:hypothetical protein
MEKCMALDIDANMNSHSLTELRGIVIYMAA